MVDRLPISSCKHNLLVHLAHIAGACNILLPGPSLINGMDVLNRSRPIRHLDIHHRARFEHVETHLLFATF